MATGSNIFGLSHDKATRSSDVESKARQDVSSMFRGSSLSSGLTAPPAITRSIRFITHMCAIMSQNIESSGKDEEDMREAFASGFRDIKSLEKVEGIPEDQSLYEWMEMLVEILHSAITYPSAEELQSITACLQFFGLGFKFDIRRTWEIFRRVQGTDHQCVLKLKQVLSFLEIPSGSFAVTCAVVDMIKALLSGISANPSYVIEDFPLVCELLRHVISELWPNHLTWTFDDREEQCKLSLQILTILNLVVRNDAWMADLEQNGPVSGRSRLLADTLEQLMEPRASYFHLQAFEILFHSSDTASSKETNAVIETSLEVYIALLLRSSIAEPCARMIVSHVFHTERETLKSLMHCLIRPDSSARVKQLILRMFSVISVVLAKSGDEVIQFRTVFGEWQDVLASHLLTTVRDTESTIRRESWRLMSTLAAHQPFMISLIHEQAMADSSTSDKSSGSNKRGLLSIALKALESKNSADAFGAAMMLSKLWASPFLFEMVSSWRSDTRIWTHFATMLECPTPTLVQYSPRAKDDGTTRSLMGIIENIITRSCLYGIVSHELHSQASTKTLHNKGLKNSRQTFSKSDVLPASLSSGLWFSGAVFDEPFIGQWIKNFPGDAEALVKSIGQNPKHDPDIVAGFRRWIGAYDRAAGQEFDLGPDLTHSLSSSGELDENVPKFARSRLKWATEASSMYDSTVLSCAELLRSWSQLVKTLSAWITENGQAVTAQYQTVVQLLQSSVHGRKLSSFQEWCDFFEPSFVVVIFDLLEHIATKLRRTTGHTSKDVAECIEVSLRMLHWPVDKMVLSEESKQETSRFVLRSHLTILRVLFQAYTKIRKAEKKNSEPTKGLSGKKDRDKLGAAELQVNLNCLRVLEGLLSSIRPRAKPFILGQTGSETDCLTEIITMVNLFGELTDPVVAGRKEQEVLTLIERNHTPQVLLGIFNSLLQLRDWKASGALTSTMHSIAANPGVAKVLLDRGFLIGLSSMPFSVPTSVRWYYDEAQERMSFDFMSWVSALRIASRVASSVRIGDSKGQHSLCGFIAAFEPRMLEVLQRMNDVSSKTQITLAQLDELVVITGLFMHHARVTSPAILAKQGLHEVSSVQVPPYQQLVLDLFLTLQHMLVMQSPLRRVAHPVTRSEREANAAAVSTEVYDPARLVKAGSTQQPEVDELRQKFYSISSNVTNNLKDGPSGQGASIPGPKRDGSSASGMSTMSQASTARQIHAHVTKNKSRTQFFASIEQRVLTVIHNLLRTVRYLTLADRVLADIPPYYKMVPGDRVKAPPGTDSSSVQQGGQFGHRVLMRSPFAIVQPSWQSASVQTTSLGILNNFMWYILIRHQEAPLAVSAMETTMIVMVSQMLYNWREDLDTPTDTFKELDTSLGTWQSLVIGKGKTTETEAKRLIGLCRNALRIMSGKRNTSSGEL